MPSVLISPFGLWLRKGATPSRELVRLGGRLAASRRAEVAQPRHVHADVHGVDDAVRALVQVKPRRPADFRVV